LAAVEAWSAAKSSWELGVVRRFLRMHRINWTQVLVFDKVLFEIAYPRLEVGETTAGNWRKR